MATKLEIYNSAFALIGDNAATADDLTGGSDGLGSENRVRAANVVWQDAFEEWLSAFPWGFVKTRATLDPYTTPLFEWAEAFILPDDFLTFVALNQDYNCEPGRDYEIENNLLLTDEEEANIEYIYLPSSSGVDLALTRANPLYRKCLITLLAAKIAPVIKADGGDRGLQLLGLYEQQLSVAIIKARHESKQAPHYPAEESRVVGSRRWFGTE